MTATQSRAMSLDFLKNEQKLKFEEKLDFDLMLAGCIGRYRINIGGFFLRSVIEIGKKHGMITMAESITTLLEAGTISEDVAKSILANYE